MSEVNRTANAVLRFFRHRQHPIKMLEYTSRNLWLLLIPLSKYLIASKFDFENWIRTNWVDILAISGIFTIAVLRWIFVSFNIERDGISARTGLFGMMRTKVYFSEITSVSFCQKWYSRPFKAHTVFIVTNARTYSKEDIRLVVSKRNADLISEFAKSAGGDTAKATYSPEKAHLLIFSLLFSSAVSGMILYGTRLFEAYKIVGLEMEQEVIRRVNGEFINIDGRFLRLSETIPRIVLLFGGMILISWLISFITTLARHWSFTVSRTKDQFHIQSGVLIKRRHIINQQKINYYDLTQTLLMKIFRICSVTLDCAGYGKSRREISALIPITTYQQMNASLKMLVPDLPRPKPEIRTGKRDIMRFITIPLMLSCIPPLLAFGARYFFPDRADEINSITAIMLIPLVWLVAVKASAAFNTYVGFSGDGCSVSYCRFYQFHRLFLPKKNISKIRITRNPMQMINKTCTLWIYTCGEKQKYHKVISMPYEEIKMLCLREGFVMFE